MIDTLVVACGFSFKTYLSAYPVIGDEIRTSIGSCLVTSVKLEPAYITVYIVQGINKGQFRS